MDRETYDSYLSRSRQLRSNSPLSSDERLIELFFFHFIGEDPDKAQKALTSDDELRVNPILVRFLVLSWLESLYNMEGLEHIRYHWEPALILRARDAAIATGLDKIASMIDRGSDIARRFEHDKSYDVLDEWSRLNSEFGEYGNNRGIAGILAGLIRDNPSSFIGRSPIGTSEKI